ncbi:translational GTPase TypA [Oscillatoria amoena NRMC-F 0135]|nr:translational GTPase TypA [Oscillatoria laete-virens]MDL5048683.1 translational GTPase TypA [Oscillatoria amoena NRMC-F 0135]MDL5053224.1 translational GTPase TypA [Oscillatoria laete-virens NRMC-F 0139]
MEQKIENIRNIAIIAHVDHGKTTLVDQLLKQAGTFRTNEATFTEERIMDSMDLEREKGITIKAKNAAFKYKDFHINIVDTPGHADFGGEVERILKMIDGVLLLVDAFDGPQAQTRFVLRKALETGAKPIVVINKIDRDNADPHKVLDMIFELFVELHATDEQLDFPVIYASAKNGFAKLEMDQESKDMQPLYETIVAKVPPPVADPAAPFSMLVSNLDYSDYLGRIAYGKISGGTVKKGDTVWCLNHKGKKTKAVVTAIFSHSGLAKVEINEARAGNIIGLSGFDEIFIGETICASETQAPLPSTEIDPPTIKMNFCVNDSPLAGKEGKFLTARHLKDRLIRETYTNVSLHVEETDSASVFNVSGRGEMQIAILVEQMRREGFELMVSRPEVIFKKDDAGTTLEPYETMYVEVPSEFLGGVLENLASRKAEIVNMQHHEKDVSVEAVIPTRGIIGFETDLMNLTKGMGIMSHLFKEYAPFKGELGTRNRGALIAMENGVSTTYALVNIQERGRLFIDAQTEVYAGMVIGENARPEDLIVNPCKAKQLTNMRSQGDGKAEGLEPALNMSLERALEYIAPDEFLEVTPGKLRIRKRILDHNARKRAS